MKKVHVIEEYAAKQLEERINILLDHEHIRVTNIQYRTAVITSAIAPEYDGDTNFSGNIYHTALVEYEVMK